MDLDLLKLFGTLRPYGSRTNDRLFLRSIRRRAAYFIKTLPRSTVQSMKMPVSIRPF